jgi:hypothetical protein
MQIPSHQIHNVLKVYSKQLSQARISERNKALVPEGTVDKINISAMGKRQSIIDKVAADIVSRITQSGPQDPVDQEILGKLEDEIGESIDFKQNRNEFVFNVISGDNKKTTSTVQVGDADYLIKRLEQLAKEAVDKNMEL